MLLYDNSRGQNICVRSKEYLRKCVNELELEMVKVYDFVYGNLEDEKKVKKEIRKLQTHKYQFIKNRNKNILSNFRLF